MNTLTKKKFLEGFIDSLTCIANGMCLITEHNGVKAQKCKVEIDAKKFINFYNSLKDD